MDSFHLDHAFELITSETFSGINCYRVKQNCKKMIDRLFKLRSAKALFVIGASVSILIAGFAAFRDREIIRSNYIHEEETVWFGKLIKLISGWANKYFCCFRANIAIYCDCLRVACKLVLLLKAHRRHSLPSALQNTSLDLHQRCQSHSTRGLLLQRWQFNWIFNVANILLHLADGASVIFRDQKGHKWRIAGIHTTKCIYNWSGWYSLRQLEQWSSLMMDSDRCCIRDLGQLLYYLEICGLYEYLYKYDRS